MKVSYWGKKLTILRYSLIFNRLKSSKYKCNLPNPEFPQESLPLCYAVKPLNEDLDMDSISLCALISRSLVLSFIFVIVLEWGICRIPSPIVSYSIRGYPFLLTLTNRGIWCFVSTVFRPYSVSKLRVLMHLSCLSVAQIVRVSFPVYQGHLFQKNLEILWNVLSPCKFC